MDLKRPLSKQPIPKNATRVFKGKIFDVYQWPQKQFDGSVAIYEKIKRLDSVETVAIFNGKIMVAKEQQPGVKPFLGAIAGKIDEGEDPLEAAKRELLEETGMEASRWEFWFATQPTQKIDWAVFSFVAKDCRKVREPALEAGERIELMEVDFDQFKKVVADKNFRDTEISLEILRSLPDPKKVDKIKRLFFN